jgi:class 3 adenylate cyclase/tetratricopeptide (TPR) repeat protein/energy-coupling factor transporter ATP-binding protein EcfA2
MATFDDVLQHVLVLLQQEGRLSYRAVKRRFALDDEYIEDLKAELIDAKRVAGDEDGKVLVWIGATPVASSEFQVSSSPQPPVPQTPNAELRTSQSPTPSPQSPASERRQLTVLFCDMVGFTELANRVDPEVLQGIIRRYEDACAVCITRYEGYVYQRLGDGIVAFFGYPLAHEGEAERAIHAGLAIIESLSTLTVPEIDRLHVRIGIATGVVVIADAEKNVVGETLNLASRLQNIAPVDSIVVSERVRRLAGGGFDYVDLGTQNLKGIAQPTRVYRIAGVNLTASRFAAATQTGLTPLVGREHEIALLLERWQLAQDGEGQVVLLSGEPGIGKSRILNALVEQLEEQSVSTLRLQCSPYHVNSAFHPIIDNFERTLQFAHDETVESKLDKLEALVVAQYGRPVEDVRFVATMLSLPSEARYGALTMTPQKHKDETLRVLVDLTAASATTQPTVLVFEDAHWADPTSLDVLDLLIDRVRTTPLLIVLTHRPEFQSRWARHGHVTALNLSKLTRAQSSAIIAKLTGDTALPAEVLGQILSKTDGVPLYVEELTKNLIEAIGTNGQSPLHFTIPATLQDALMARLDRLGSAKEIAQIGAALGREFSYALLAAVTATPTIALDHALQQLTDSGLAFRRGAPPEATYTFKHALVQDAAYDSLLKSRRQELHATIARVLAADFPQVTTSEPELLAHHLTVAGQAAAAIPLWQQAGTLALARWALTEAIAHLNQGMTLIGTLPLSPERDGHELDLRMPLGMAWLKLKGWAAPEVWINLHPALALAKSISRHEALLPIYYGLWINLRNQGRVAESLNWVNEVLTTAERSGDQDLLLVAHHAACITHFWRGDLGQSQEHGERVFSLYDEAQHRYLVDIVNNDPESTVGIYVSVGTWLLGYPDRAVKVTETSIAHARQRTHPFHLGWVLTVGAIVWDFRGEPEQLLVRVEEAERLDRAYSLPVISEVLAQLFKGIACLRAGRIAEGIPQLRGALGMFIAHGGGNGVPYLRAVLAEGLALSGDVEDGLQLIEESLTQIARPGWEERWCLAEVLRLKGVLTLEAGGWRLETSSSSPQAPSLKPLVSSGAEREAEECFLQAIAVAQEQHAKSWELRAATSLARLWQHQGKRTEAHKLLSEVYNWFTEGFDTKDLQEAKALLEELHR